MIQSLGAVLAPGLLLLTRQAAALPMGRRMPVHPPVRTKRRLRTRPASSMKAVMAPEASR
jgi:hypothetical protein